MVFYITVLRALAAMLITNAHYTGVYPNDIVANGGLLGDIIFFTVSGYGLYNVKLNFPKWYAKRLYRIYLPVFLITITYLFAGFYSLSYHSPFWWFIYPTNYHFIASIAILYIPYYAIVSNKYMKEKLVTVALAIACIWFAVYLLAYDSSYYHIDTVREPMIRFLFLEAMLIGAYFRKNDEKYRNKFSILSVVSLFLLLIVYFASKLLFVRIHGIAHLQIANQIIILLLLYNIMYVMAGIDDKLNALPSVIKKLFTFTAKITLEIYLVQYVIIDKLRNVYFFPVNWLILTGTILLSALVLHTVCNIVYKTIDKITEG